MWHLLGFLPMRDVARTILWSDPNSNKSVALEPSKHTDLEEAMKSIRRFMPAELQNVQPSTNGSWWICNHTTYINENKQIHVYTYINVLQHVKNGVMVLHKHNQYAHTYVRMYTQDYTRMYSRTSLRS